MAERLVPSNLHNMHVLWYDPIGWEHTVMSWCYKKCAV